MIFYFYRGVVLIFGISLLSCEAQEKPASVNRSVQCDRSAVSITGDVYQVDSVLARSTAHKECLAKIIDTTNIASYYSKKLIPTSVQHFLHFSNNNLQFADPGELWNSSDAKDPDQSMPDKQIVFIGVSKDICAISFLRGGFVIERNLIILRYSDRQVTDMWFGITREDIKNKKQLFEFLR